MLSDVQLKGGGSASVQAINALTILVCANEGAVFVSCKSQMVHNQNMIVAFVNCIMGEGGTMYTKFLGLNPAGAILVPTAN